MIPVKGFSGQKVAVLGLGRSGLATARALQAGMGLLKTQIATVLACALLGGTHSTARRLDQPQMTAFRALPANTALLAK